MTGNDARRGRASSARWWLTLAAVVLLSAGCRQDMHDQPKIESLEANAFFANGMGARPIPADTVARGQLHEDTEYWAGRDASGELIDRLPARVTLDAELVARGRQRFEIYCGVCHDSRGGGQGMVVRRGFKQPQPLYESRLVEMPAGYFFDVISNGFGLMSSYAKQVPVADRWAIVAYIRALQISQASQLADLPSALQNEFRDALARAEHAPAGDHTGHAGHAGDSHE